MNTEIKTKVLVIGGGPSGYSAAFRCADLGLETLIVERYDKLGGVCLNVGCIPSKALLHIAKIITEAKLLKKYGIFVNETNTDINKIRSWKEKIITKLTTNLNHMAKMRNIKILNGYGKFTGINTMDVLSKNYITKVIFENAIIAAGSSPIKLKFDQYNDSRIWKSSDALELTSIPKRLMIIGGGIIGLEIATIYHSLGSEIDIVEQFDQLIPAADKDIINFYTKKISNYFNLMLETKITDIKTKKDGIYVSMEGKKDISKTKCYDTILVAIGRMPNGQKINANQAGIKIDNNGFIIIDKQMRTNIPHIYAIGDIVGQPMLAHKGIKEGHVAAEVIAGKNNFFDPKVIPYIAYTDPEIAWVGITEKEAKNKGIQYKTATFPWTASGRAVSSNCQDGMTKLIFNKKNNTIIGGAVVGVNGGELLGEICLAIEMGCDAEDIALTIHAHPTLHESIGLCAEIYEGIITDLPNIK